MIRRSYVEDGKHGDKYVSIRPTYDRVISPPPLLLSSVRFLSSHRVIPVATAAGHSVGGE